MGLSGQGASEQRLRALLVQAGLPWRFRRGPVSSASFHSCAEPVAQQAVWAPAPCLAGRELHSDGVGLLGEPDASVRIQPQLLSLLASWVAPGLVAEDTAGDR